MAAMAATPPLQIQSSVRTPPTPRHGPTVDNVDPTQPRYATRASQRRAPGEALATPEAVKATPPGSRLTPLAGQSPRSARNLTPNTAHLHSSQISARRKSNRRVQITSPSSAGLGSPAPGSPAPTPIPTSKRQPAFLSSTAVMADGMLPTPVKTPRKKNIPSVSAAARALFQDQPMLGEEVTVKSGRGRRGRRYNGFTLESFTADEAASGKIQIFTDSRDTVPQIDTSEDNPFIDHQAKAEGSSGRRVAGTSKRRKVSSEQKIDRHIQQAVDNEEGMIYVFRGKKLYRKFDDASSDEEDIDTTDLGLLERHGELSSVAPVKSLTRKSIKPTRLFQTEEQKRARDAEKEEEALTDIEGHSSHNTPHLASPSTPTKDSDSHTPATPPLTGRALRSTAKKDGADTYVANTTAVEKSKAKKPKKASPFDSWKRVKAGASAELSKGKKRGSEALDHGDTVTSKRSKAD